MILLIDNYDSFVYNLARYARELGWDVLVCRHDAITVPEIEALAPSHIVLSPGPCTPSEAGISTTVVGELGDRIPVLGVCLGHQCIGEAYGASIVRATRPMHGKASRVSHDGTSIFAGVPSPLVAARYHSLVIAERSLPASLRVLARADDDGEIMAVAHRTHPVVGVQFHPESVATEHGYALLDAFFSQRLDGPVRETSLPREADSLMAAGEGCWRLGKTTLDAEAVGVRRELVRCDVHRRRRVGRAL
jgi:anthranilate synthase/aminodeoxychorismate synthase-like glutamine amidotransferase